MYKEDGEKKEGKRVREREHGRELWHTAVR
jgi:hypothetical protein